MILALIAASITFTATATGVEKGTPVEFVFAGRNTDRAYETMFLLDEDIGALCSRLEKAGLPCGKPVDRSNCRLWPVGTQLRFDPPISAFIAGKMPEGLSDSSPIYTGGTRLTGGACEAVTNMPASFFSIYTLPQSAIVYNGIYNQGEVYGAFTAADKLKKGARTTFTVSWDERTTPRSLTASIKPGNAVEVIKHLREEAAKGDIEVLVDFDENLTVAEATEAALALETIDSVHVKLNGCTDFFYRSFLPLVKWLDRKERLTQPFELTLGDSDKLLFIEEDWTVEGLDPKLTPREIAPSEVAKHPKTDTCFIYATKDTRLSRVKQAKQKLKAGNILNWYVFSR